MVLPEQAAKNDSSSRNGAALLVSTPSGPPAHKLFEMAPTAQPMRQLRSRKPTQSEVAGWQVGTKIKKAGGRRTMDDGRWTMARLQRNGGARTEDREMIVRRENGLVAEI